MTDRDNLFIRQIVSGVIDNIQEGVIVAKHDGSIIYINKRVLEMHGQKKSSAFIDNIKNYPKIVKLYSYPDKKLLKASESPMPRILKGQKIDDKIYVKHSDTSQLMLYHFSSKFLPVAAFQKDTILLTISDKTLLDENKEQAGSSHQRFEMLFNNAPEAIMLADNDGRCKDSNIAAAKLFGYSHEEMIGMTISDFVTLSKVSKLAEARRKTTQTNYLTEWEVVKKDGTSFYAEIHSQLLPNGDWIEFIRDISDRKRVEDEILASEERFRKLTERSYDTIAVIDREGFFEYVTPGITDTVGYQPEDIIGNNVFNYLHPDELTGLKQTFQKVLDNPDVPVTIQSQFLAKNNKFVWVESTVRNLLNDKDIGGIVSNFRNINDRKEAEDEHLYQSELLKTVIGTTTLGFFMLDAKNECIYMNKVGEAMTGYKLEELDGKPFHDIIHHTRPDGTSYKIADCPLQEIRKNNKQLHGEETFINKDGGFFQVRYAANPIIKHGEYTGMVIEMQDITDELAIQQALVASNERFKQLADSMPQIVWSAHAEGGNDYLNRRWYEFSGFKKSETRSWDEILHPDDVKEYLKTWQHSLKTGQQFEIEYRFKDYRTGEYRWFLGRALPIRDSEGAIIRWYGTCTDIDEVRKTSQYNRDLEAETIRLTARTDALIALNKAKDDFISLASHQLRTPATAVKAYTGMLLEGYAGTLSKTQMKFLKQAYDSNERQLQTIDDLLNVAQIDTGQFVLNKQKYDLITLIRDVIEEQHDKFKTRKQTITFEHKNPSLKAHIDPARLRMVFENLIDNASKYSTNNTSVSVSVRRKGKNTVEIIIQDQGVGIDEADVGRLFQKFSRIGNLLSEAVGGTGLGLYWAKKIVDLHGGTIDVKSVKDTGTTFTIVIPT